MEHDAATIAAYPAWICADCGLKFGKRRPLWATWHTGRCGWCDETASVTEPRDFGYPSYLDTKKDADHG